MCPLGPGLAAGGGASYQVRSSRGRGTIAGGDERIVQGDHEQGAEGVAADASLGRAVGQVEASE